MRLLLLFVLLLAALGVSLSVFFYLDNEEEAKFQDQFQNDASKLLDSIASIFDNTLGPGDSLTVNLVAYARQTQTLTNQSFPFVTLPSYGLQASKMLRVAKAFHVHTSFIVEENKADAWKEYADSQLHHIDEALDILDSDPDWTGEIYRDYERCYDIYTLGGVPVDTPTNYTNTYIPNWMEYPVLGNYNGLGNCPYNYDHWRLPYIAVALQHMMQTQQVVVGNFPAANYDLSDPAQVEQKGHSDAWVLAHFPNGTEVEPNTQIGFPIFDTVDSVYVDVNKRQKFVGYMALTVMFRRLIENALPANSEGIILVVDQGMCGNPFTYRIDGPTATYLGVGDMHETRFDAMVHSEVWQEMPDQAKNGGRVSSYTGVPVSAVFCPNLM